MAKKQELTTGTTDATADNAADAIATPIATPENTPVPGGGRWRWDIAKPGWVEVDEDGAPVVAAADPVNPAALPVDQTTTTPV